MSINKKNIFHLLLKRRVIAKQKSTQKGECEVVREIKARNQDDEVRAYARFIHDTFISAVFLDN